MKLTILTLGKLLDPSFRITTKLLKVLKHVKSKPIEILFNYSFSQGTVPSNFKITRVIPVYKKGSPTSVDNYRPISLLSIFNRLLEKLMYNRLVAYLEKVNVLCENQFMVLGIIILQSMP